MARAAAAFEGTHDFRAVRSVGTETKTTVRTIYWCRAEKQGDIITIAVCADGFLYNMVRAIVGTLVYASYGKLAPDDIPRLLDLGDRRLTGPTMPPQGLYMNRVWYDGPAGEMMADPEYAPAAVAADPIACLDDMGYNMLQYEVDNKGGAHGTIFPVSTEKDPARLR